VNQVEGRFLLDTGNSNELLVFHRFAAAHPGLVPFSISRMQSDPRGTSSFHFAENRGVGGSSSAVMAIVNQLELGPFKLYNRMTDVMLSDTGAFADRNEAGNIGLGSLRNFVITFDYASHTLYLDRPRWFDDGRYRNVP
jgi:hypothetical protein